MVVREEVSDLDVGRREISTNRYSSRMHWCSLARSCVEILYNFFRFFYGNFYIVDLIILIIKN